MTHPNWPPSPEELQAVVNEWGYKGAARKFGVDVHTVRKYAARVGVKSPFKPGTNATVLNRWKAEGKVPPGPSEQDEIRQEAERQRQALEQRATVRAIRERGSLELVLEQMREIITPLNRRNIDLISVPVGKGDEEEAVALVSDQQIGEVVDPVEMQGLGAYCRELFALRVERWAKAIMKITRLHQHAYPLRKLHVWFLGDNTDGVLIYRGQSWHLDAVKLEQMFIGTQAFARALASLLQVYESIHVTGILGNHGREGRKGETRRIDNSDILFYYTLSLLLANYRDRIAWEVPRSHFALKEVQGWRFLLTHGDEINASQTYNIPFYGVRRADAGYTKMLASKKLGYEYMVLGHHHTASMIDSETGEEITNGSWVGGNELSIRKKRTLSVPTQLFFGVHERKGITWRYKIRLYEPGDEELVPARAPWPVFGEILPRGGQACE